MSKLESGRILEWNGRRGFGFLDHGGVRLFLHIQDFAEKHHTPRKGDLVSFLVGTDARGRPCALRARAVSTRSPLRIAHFLALTLLLVLPMIAALKTPLESWMLAGYMAIISMITWTAYKEDKRRARTGQWRTAEATLHLLDLLGGWPGAFLAQRIHRHKIAKASFQFTFWSIVFGYQFVSLDYLADWQWSRMFLDAIETLASKA